MAEFEVGKTYQSRDDGVGDATVVYKHRDGRLVAAFANTALCVLSSQGCCLANDAYSLRPPHPHADLIAKARQQIETRSAFALYNVGESRLHTETMRRLTDALEAAKFD